MNIIIAMAGEGARFKQNGIGVPKHMILVKGSSLFEWALKSLTNFFDKEFIFIARRSNDAKDFVQEKSRALGIKNLQIKELGHATRGQAATVMEAERLIRDPAEEIIIYNIDTYVEEQQLRPEQIRGDGWVPVFETEGDHWSFAKFGSDYRVTQMTEKKRISEYGSIGLYYFKSFAIFKDAYQRYYQRVELKEEYVAPIYNILLEDHKEIYASVIDRHKVHVLGTPEEAEVFEKDGR